MRMPTLETDRLLIRPFTMDDLAAIHQILDVELASADFGTEGAQSLAERRQWLQWTVLNYEELAKLYQPPYGDRAIVLKDGQALIGACGYVPCLDAFGQLPAFGAAHDATRRGLTTTAFGLYWAVSPRYQRRGYATEAAGALVRYAFTNLNLRRIIATTTHENAASLGVMRKLGMRIERNPYPAPPWLQAVGILDNPALAANDEEQR
ncbi:MAG: GNAT family N-acetyltransferase [Thermomicrobiales bacterium]